MAKGEWETEQPWLGLYQQVALWNEEARGLKKQAEVLLRCAEELATSVELLRKA